MIQHLPLHQISQYFPSSALIYRNSVRFGVSHVEDNHGLILSPWFAVKRTATESLAVVELVLLMDTDLSDDTRRMV